MKFINVNEKALRETQTLRAGCSKAEPKIFALLQLSVVKFDWSFARLTAPVVTTTSVVLSTNKTG